MKDQYAGDVGDYVKLGLLRALFHDRRLAVDWFRTADDAGSKDGKFIHYLQPEFANKWRVFDPELYDYLKSAIDRDERSIDMLQRALIGPGREFYDRIIERPASRAVWFSLFSHWLTTSDMLYLDPDNGISSSQRLPSLKSVTVDEVQYLLNRVDTLLIYHHQTRSKGGHIEKIKRIGAALVPEYDHQSACAIRASSGSVRAFF